MKWKFFRTTSRLENVWTQEAIISVKNNTTIPFIQERKRPERARERERERNHDYPCGPHKPKKNEPSRPYLWLPEIDKRRGVRKYPCSLLRNVFKDLFTYVCPPPPLTFFPLSFLIDFFSSLSAIFFPFKENYWESPICCSDWDISKTHFFLPYHLLL